MTIYTPAKEINCEYFSRCSSVKTKDVYNFRNLIKTHCSQNGTDCEKKTSLISKRIMEGINQ